MVIPPGSHDASVLVLGGDLGGTSTRILVADRDGVAHGRGAAGGGNPTTHPDTAAAALGQALGDALDGIESSLVRAAVIGLAGGGARQGRGVRDALAHAWAAAGLVISPEYVGDLDVAFASGTAEPDGTVLIAGTGAAAGAVRNRRVVRTADGHGWLLGDEGSGFWLGREAVRSTLRTLDAAERPGPLAESVLRKLGAWSATATEESGSGRRARVIHAVNSRPPIRIAELAPLVTAAFEMHDPVAEDIVQHAARLLAGALGRVRAPDEQTPLVLAGRVVEEGSPVGSELRRLVRERFRGTVVSAQDGLGGATWLALASIDAAAATGAVRARLVQPDRGRTC